MTKMFFTSGRHLTPHPWPSFTIDSSKQESLQLERVDYENFGLEACWCYSSHARALFKALGALFQAPFKSYFGREQKC